MVTSTIDIPVCEVAVLAEATPRVFRIEGRAVAVVRIADDVIAFDAFCPHWKGPLGSGKVSVDRLEITCPWHNFRYSLSDGRCVAANNRPSVELFPVTVSDGMVMVSVHAKGASTAA
jgi:nitrite reductase/ring-hydroxylating ferredoxin subunit